MLVVFHAVLGRRYGVIEYDIYPQIMAAMGLVRGNGFVYRIWWRWHAWALMRANIVIAIADEMADELRSMVRTGSVNLVTVPTWTDTDRIRPIPRTENPFVRSLGLETDLCIIYSGNLGETHAIETIVEIAGRLIARTHIRFVVIGDGSKRPIVEDAIESGRAPNITLLPPQESAVFPLALASADIAFVTLADGYERLSLPSKTYDMMAAGCAIIGISPSSSGLAQLLETHAVGRNFEPSQVTDIVAWIEEIAGNRSTLEVHRRAARNAAEAHFGATVCQPAMTRAISRIWPILRPRDKKRNGLAGQR
ncbi:MAG: glycosyltransferase [Chloroflexi bacterium]|nr:glycosyltransferase [Chloroflexota bacterium]